MKRTVLTMVLAAAVVVIGRAAQAPPDLSGTWRPQNPNSGQANPFEFTITQAADSVTIRTPLGNPESVTLKLNAETRTPISGRGGASATAVSTASWEGAKLVVTTAITGGPNGAISSARQVYSLTGDTLTLEASNSLPDGSMSQVRTATYGKYTPVTMPAPPGRPAESGYTSLFNGKDLTGWKASANPDSFKVENGAIIANAAGQASHLFYDGPVGNHSFTNFDLRLDVLARYRSNGGVYVMTEFRERASRSRSTTATAIASALAACTTSWISRISPGKTTSGYRWRSRLRGTRLRSRSRGRRSSAGRSRPTGKATTIRPAARSHPARSRFSRTIRTA